MRALVATGLVMVLFVSGCSGSAGDPVSTSEADVSAETTVEGKTDTQSPASLVTTTTSVERAVGDAGALDDPLGVGAVAIVGDWSVRVASVVADAGDLVMAENQFNEPPADGNQFFLANLEATYIGDDSSTFWIDMTLKVVGDSNVAYESFGASCGVIPDSINDAGETFPGGTISGNSCWEVSAGDAASLVLIIEESFSFGETRSFLSLDPTAAPLIDSTAIDGAAGADVSAAVEVGEVAQVGDWSIRISEVLSDATDRVADENEFNDPPGEGKQFFMATVEATYTGDESSTFWTDLSLKTVGASNVAYESFDAYCGVIPDPINDYGEAFPGGTIVGNTCWTINSADADSLAMIAEDPFSFDESRTFFSLDSTVSPIEATTAIDAVGISAIETISLSETAQVGSWSLRVLNASENATDLVLSENPFNDPPNDGKQFHIVALEATYTGDESSTFWTDMTLKTVGDSSVAYEGFDGYCGVIPDPIDEAGETFPGGTVTGNECWIIASADADTLILIAEESFSFDNTRAFLALR